MLNLKLVKKGRNNNGTSKKKKKDLIGFSPKKKRFIELLRKITKQFNEYEIQRFASIRFDRKEKKVN